MIIRRHILSRLLCLMVLISGNMSNAVSFGEMFSYAKDTLLSKKGLASIAAVLSCSVAWANYQLRNTAAHDDLSHMRGRDLSEGANQPLTLVDRTRLKKEKELYEKNVTIFAHGYGADVEHGMCYFNQCIATPVYLFQFQDAADSMMRASCLGQEKEYQLLDAQIKSAQIKDKTKILYGVSRGAVTILNELAINKPAVAAAVLESPFDSLYNVVKNMMGYAHHIPGFSFLVHRFLVPLWLPNYEPQGVQPIECVKDIDKELPILLVCSEQDTLIPARSTIQLFIELLKTGHNPDKVYLLVLKEGAHANMQCEIYRNVVHAFYKKFKLPCQPHSAAAGEHYLKNACRYTVEQAENALKALQ